MPILALDLGEKKVGVAISKSKIIAEPLLTLDFNDDFFSKLGDLCRREGIKKIIVGLPKNFSSSDNKQEREIKEMAKKIKNKLKIKIELIDESFTTSIARERGTSDLHQEAAVIILEDYLAKK